MAVVKPEEKRQLFERLANVREIVFGIQDGVLTTAGVLAGLSGAVSTRREVILAALASTAAGALSMGAGAYLGTHAETEVLRLRSEIQRTRRESAAQPYVIQESLLDELAKEGLSREASYRVVQLLSSAPRALFSTAEAKIYGLAGATFGNAVTDGLLMGVAFLAGALVPLVPFVLISTVYAGLIAGMATTALVLFAVGYFVEGRLSDAPHPSVSGLRFLAIAMGAAAIGYFIGLVIAPIGAIPAP